MRVLITGAAGFIAGYLVEELLENGYQVVGIDNFSKYGPVAMEHDNHSNYEFVTGDVKNVDLLKELISDCDHVVAAAAMIGGITYFHKLAYDLLAENERIIASTFDAAIWAYKHKRLKKITVVSSSMVFENSLRFPTPEGEERRCPPPSSTYGFQKLATEYFAQGAWEQYGLPFTVVRPFNCVGVGERRAVNSHPILSGNIKLTMSHVVPDLIHKTLKGQDPLHILGNGQQVRHYTYGGDIAKGIRLCLEHPTATNESFNLSTRESTTVLELAQTIWAKCRPATPFRYVSDPPMRYDVQKRIPDVTKAQKLLGFEALTPLSDVLDEMIPWIKRQIDLGTI
jgi:UDP-glucose 4-epimerase